MAEADEFFSDVEVDIDSDGEEEGSGDEDIDPFASERTHGNTVTKITGDDRKYTPILTSFILARIIPTRADQIDAGSPVGIDPREKGFTRSLDIAAEELKQGKCPLYVGMMSNDGKKVEYWHVNELQTTESRTKEDILPPIDRIKNMSLEDLVGDCVAWPKIRQQRKDRFPDLAVGPSQPKGGAASTPKKKVVVLSSSSE